MNTEVLSLLRSKNRCLERFLSVTAAFWQSASQDDLSDLTAFENRRATTLRAIELYDRKIEQSANRILPEDRTPAMVEEIRACLMAREEIIHKILDLDLRIIEKIEAARSKLLEEMNATRKGRDAIGKFKSTWIKEGGEELDQKV